METEEVLVYVNRKSGEDLFEGLMNDEDFSLRYIEFYMEFANKQFDKRKLVGDFLEEVKSI
jgi:hypothetical protein